MMNFDVYVRNVKKIQTFIKILFQIEKLKIFQIHLVMDWIFYFLRQQKKFNLHQRILFRLFRVISVEIFVELYDPHYLKH